MPRPLLTQLNGYLEDAGLSRTEIIVRAISFYLQSEQKDFLGQRMNKVEQKILELENKIKTA